MRLEVGWGQDGKGDGESKMGIGSGMGSGMGSRTGNRVQHGTRTHAGLGQDSCPLGRTRPVLTVSLCVPPCPRRLERLQRVVTKLQMESGLCEEQLNQADALLQAVSVGGTGVGGPGGTSPGHAAGCGLTVPAPQDVRLLAAGKAPQKAAEVERDLDKADAMIRLLFNDVQSLKDGRHPQGEQMYRRYGRCGGPHGLSPWPCAPEPSMPPLS